MSDAVHVVGAGFAGAAAAVTLAQAGRRVVLWEARPEAGGRASSFTDAGSGERLDNGPHLLMGAYHRTRALLDRIGTGGQLCYQPAMRLPVYVRGRETHLRCPALPAPWFLVFGLLGMEGLNWGERLRLLKAGHRLNGPVPVGATVADWLDHIGAPAASVNLLWAPLCRAIMNLEPGEADAATLVSALREALTRTPGDARLAWAREGLGALLHPALSRFLAGRGGTVHRGRVARLRLDARGAVTGLITVSGDVVDAEAVVLATDSSQLPRLLPPSAAALADLVGGMGTAPVISVYLWFDRRVIAMGAEPFVGLVGGRAEWVFDRDLMTRKDGGKGQRLAAVISAGDDLADRPENDVVKQALDDISRHFPGVRKARLTHARVVKERRATVRIGPDTARPLPGPVAGVPGLYLCGDFTDTGLPATIEGAVRSGETAVSGLCQR